MCRFRGEAARDASEWKANNICAKSGQKSRFCCKVSEHKDASQADKQKQYRCEAMERIRKKA